MKSELINKAAQVITDPAMLINAVSQRVKQLTEGYSPLVQPPGPEYGEADIALLEIIAGKVTIKDPELAED